ncbi:MAG TPA: hypothetical protein VEI54_08325 [Candidatus Limnocylindrales bacterium]|nr:hypothetical protein [Candidatus Limnocylindrales bacterium]
MSVSRIRFTRVLWLTLAVPLFLLSPLAIPHAPFPQQDAPLTKEQLDARDAINQGVAAFKNAQFDEAERLFQRAKQLDPSLQNATLYLATTYASQYIPGAPSEENIQRGKLAAQEYREVLGRDPTNLSAIDGLASILYQMAGQPFSPELFTESKTFHQKHIELKPQDPQPYYSVGVIDWALAYRANTQLRAEFNKSVGGQGLKDMDPLPEFLRSEYAREYGPTVDEGIDHLHRAIALKPDYDDAMVYLNLLYRRKADMVASPAERDRLTDQANDLLDKVRDIKQSRARNTPRGSN